MPAACCARSRPASRRRAKSCRSAPSCTASPASRAIAKSSPLLLSSLAAAGARGLHLDLGHVGVYRALANGAGIAGNGDDSELFAALRAKDVPAVAALTAKLPRRVARCAHGAADAVRPGAGRARRSAGAAARHAGDRQCARPRWPRSPSRPAATSRRCTSISPTSPAIITRTARSSRCSPPARRAPSATAAATTASARHSAARVPPPASRFDLRQLAGVVARDR